MNQIWNWLQEASYAARYLKPGQYECEGGDHAGCQVGG
jgi:hypothetical protein